MMFNMPLAKLYTNSLMSTLNSRRTLIAAASNGSESRGHIAQRSGVNVNIPRGERGGRKSIRVRAFLSFLSLRNPLHHLLELKKKNLSFLSFGMRDTEMLIRVKYGRRRSGS